MLGVMCWPSPVGPHSLDSCLSAVERVTVRGNVQAMIAGIRKVMAEMGITSTFFRS